MQNQQLKFADALKDPAFKEFDSSTDGILRAEDGTEFSINRNILAQRCPYFKALFFGGFADGTKVTLREISAETLETIIVHLYNNVASLTEENALDVLFASDYFLIDALRQKSKSFILSKMSIDNCFPLFRLAWYFKTLGIFDDCRRFFACNFEDVTSCSKEIGTIPFEALKSVLCDENLNVSGERTVWNVIVRWVNHDKPARLRFVPELLKYICFEDLDGQLKNDIVFEDIVQDNSFCRELIFSNRKHTYGLRSFRKILSSQSHVRASRIPRDLHICVQYSLPDRSNIYLGTVGDETAYVHRMGTMDFLPDYLVQLDRYVYMFADDGNRSLIFDVFDEKCLPMPPIPGERSRYKIVAANGSIYAFGCDIPSAFIFDPRLGKWDSFGYDYSKLIVAAAALNNRIYVIEKTLYYFRIYNPASNKWSNLKPPKSLGEGVLIPFQGHLLYIGKGDSKSVYGTVKKYDPLKKTWAAMPSLPFVYKNPQVVVFNNILRVYEEKGFKESAPPVYWESDDQTWPMIDGSTSLRYAIHKFRFCTIAEPNIIKEIVKRNRSKCNSWIRFSAI